MAGHAVSRPIERPPAIVVLGSGALVTARAIQKHYPAALIYGLRSRVGDADVGYDDFGATVRELYRNDTDIVALCAAGIVIRTLAPLLADKGAEPAVLAVAENGSAVVPLLGGIGGANVLARQIALLLGVAPAITTSGELRFGTCLLDPPAGYALADLEQGKHFVADLLGGAAVAVDGDAQWLAAVDLPLDPAAVHRIRVSPRVGTGEGAGFRVATLTPAPANCANSPDAVPTIQRSDIGGRTHGSDSSAGATLLIHPRCVAVMVAVVDGDLPERVAQLLREADIAMQALACMVAPASLISEPALAAVAAHCAVPLRFVDNTGGAAELLAQTLARAGVACSDTLRTAQGLALAVAARPLDPTLIGRARGRLTVVGLGPGAAEFMVPAARAALDQADDILGYETYVRMAGPFRAEQTLHCSDNREELQRARHAFELAAGGRAAVLVSSGDPGVFAMAAAVLEVLDAPSAEPAWRDVELLIYPGVSAALATAARAGAPLGHDFCMISLSDNLKPWAQIEARLEHAVAGDFAVALYNPVSRARPWQLGRALEIIGGTRTPATVVVLGRDIGRPGEALTVTTLGELRPGQVDSRTLVIIGSSLTRRFARPDGESWVYTPRFYPG
jgi:cobalt-precorrin 5A hydrolase/precorrin-3B C17-methyltransferase